MSNAQKFYDLICGSGDQGAEAMDTGHIPTEISVLPAVRMAQDPLMEIYCPTSDQFTLFSGRLSPRDGSGLLVFPLTVVWEVRIGGVNYVNQRPIVTRKTVLTSEADVRRGFVFSMQSPLFRRVILSARVKSPIEIAGAFPDGTPAPAGTAQGGMVVVEFDAYVNNSGNDGKLLVQTGDVIG